MLGLLTRVSARGGAVGIGPSAFSLEQPRHRPVCACLLAGCASCVRSGASCFRHGVPCEACYSSAYHASYVLGEAGEYEGVDGERLAVDTSASPWSLVVHTWPRVFGIFMIGNGILGVIILVGSISTN